MINDFSKPEYRFLSNFYPCDIDFYGEHYPSAEHAFQAFKSIDPGVRIQFQSPTPLTAGQAKRLGRKLILRPNWDNVKLSLMTLVVAEKFRHIELMNMLISTFPHMLVEGNNWGDTYWGRCNGIGANHLGIILMQIREKYIVLNQSYRKGGGI